MLLNSVLNDAALTVLEPMLAQGVRHSLKIAYEILKSLDFEKDFGISHKITRFHLRFQNLAKILRFQ